ncbi:hypothetical protein [Nocardioides sp. GY 10127]|uniref:hypothetical protein n=1 Tax=Nocardioides sp. GY 10127 TaxID=2569762 RepID=UPI0010A8F5A2|nr:hypothetical protein [Nocardioides sp. GY 10127]TIC84235.1 hypothetical protein E8D37_05455 [Nocardioides sp. GY 10127]
MSVDQRVPGQGPEDEDLTEVVRHLGQTFGRDGRPRPRSANEPEVRWCLEAGVRALHEEFCRFEQGEHQAVLPANELVGAVSLRRVMDAYAELLVEHGRDPGHASRDRVLRRWGSTTAFQRDVLRYVFRPGREEARLAARAAQLPALMELTLGELVELLAAEESAIQSADPVIQLQDALQSAFPADARLQELARLNLERRTAAWADLYRVLGEAYAIRLLRPGWEWTDLAAVLGTLVEGAHRRSVAFREVPVLTTGAPLAREMVVLVLEALDGRPWAELAGLRADPARRPHVTS